MRYFSIVIIVLIFASCFPIKQARKIDVNEVATSEVGGASSFTFKFNGNQSLFEQTTKAFFGLRRNDYIDSFLSTRLYQGDSLWITIQTFTDKDKWVQLVTLNNVINHNNDDVEKDPLIGEKKHFYVAMQVTDLQGNDILKEESMRNKAVMEKLRAYQRLID